MSLSSLLMGFFLHIHKAGLQPGPLKAILSPTFHQCGFLIKQGLLIVKRCLESSQTLVVPSQRLLLSISKMVVITHLFLHANYEKVKILNNVKSKSSILTKTKIPRSLIKKTCTGEGIMNHKPWWVWLHMSETGHL
jgi:hypothetical protein